MDASDTLIDLLSSNNPSSTFFLPGTTYNLLLKNHCWLFWRWMELACKFDSSWILVCHGCLCFDMVSSYNHWIVGRYLNLVNCSSLHCASILHSISLLMHGLLFCNCFINNFHFLFCIATVWYKFSKNFLLFFRVGSSARQQLVTTPNVHSTGHGGGSSKSSGYWSPKLHRCFLVALEELGGAYGMFRTNLFLVLFVPQTWINWVLFNSIWYSLSIIMPER